MSDYLARRDDPETSREAARRAHEFMNSHEDLIVGALGIQGTAHDIARRTGLDAVAVDRRVAKLIAEHRIKVLPETQPSPSGRPCRVYLQTTFDEQDAAKRVQPELFA